MIPLHEIILRLSFAAFLGAVIGIERDVHKRPAGIRTSLFVCLATALFTISSGVIAQHWGDSGTTRIASNIVQGVGFLGAGAILRSAGSVIGMTTAATIFVEAAIGMAAGGGLYAVAAFSTGLVLFGLVVIGWIERVCDLKPRMMLFRVTTGQGQSVATQVQTLLANMKVPIDHFRISMAGANSTVEFNADVRHQQQQEIVTELAREGVVTEVIPVEGRAE